MATNAAKMQKGFHDLTRALAEAVPALSQAANNVQWAASQIAYSKRKGRK